jgi:hypothetical protein
MLLKIEKNGADCWSVLANCEGEWHWIMTTMGPDAMKSANEWMNSLSKILEKETNLEAWNKNE